MPEITKRYTCSSIYTVNPISDLNPLIVQKYLSIINSRLLVLCAREQQVKRINKLYLGLAQPLIISVGWWELQLMGFLDENKLVSKKEILAFTGVVLLDKPRIDTSFLSLVEQVELILK